MTTELTFPPWEAGCWGVSSTWELDPMPLRPDPRRSPTRSTPSPASVDTPVSIGVAARIAGITVRMARHYEAVGLLPPANRTRTGERRFNRADLHTLAFIARARALGFPLEAVRTLLSLWHDPHRSNADTLALAEVQLEELEGKRAVLETMSAALQRLIDACAGDGRSECPILDDLAELPRSPRAR